MATLTSVVKELSKMGFSQSFLAKKGKVSQMTICRWSKGEPGLVNVAALDRLSKFLASEKSKKA